MMDAFRLFILFCFIFTDDKSDSKSSAALTELVQLENIDDECDQKVYYIVIW